MKASILNFTVHAVVPSFTAMVVSLLFLIICLRGQTIRKFWLIEDVTAVQEKNAASTHYTYGAGIGKRIGIYDHQASAELCRESAQTWDAL